MLKCLKYDLSVIVVSSRPKWLANCLSQLDKQKKEGFSVEKIVVCEGDNKNFGIVCDRYKIKDVVFKGVEGFAGAYGKDIGIRKATGDYVCFWDDDNIYEDEALSILYNAAKDCDIGIAKCRLMAFGFKLIPIFNEIKFGDVDTMCLCVRRTLALKAKWSDHLAPGTDYMWLKKLEKFTPTIKYVDGCVGDHLNDKEN